jgi:hypothetical protein
MPLTFSTDYALRLFDALERLSQRRLRRLISSTLFLVGGQHYEAQDTLAIDLFGIFPDLSKRSVKPNVHPNID